MNVCRVNDIKRSIEERIITTERKTKEIKKESSIEKEQVHDHFISFLFSSVIVCAHFVFS